MAANVFISFDHDDQKQVAALLLLKSNPKHPLDFRAHSLKEPATGRTGKPLTYPPSDPRLKPSVVRRCPSSPSSSEGRPTSSKRFSGTAGYGKRVRHGGHRWRSRRRAEKEAQEEAGSCAKGCGTAHSSLR